MPAGGSLGFVSSVESSVTSGVVPAHASDKCAAWMLDAGMLASRLELQSGGFRLVHRTVSSLAAHLDQVAVASCRSAWT